MRPSGPQNYQSRFSLELCYYDNRQNRPVGLDNSELLAILLRVMPSKGTALARLPLIAVERALWAEVKEGRPSLQNVASTLAMSPRTLQRRLNDEGTSFSEILEAFRQQMATVLLEDDKLAVYEIAFLLGYSEPSTFHRAFRRWTDRSPREFRSSSSGDS